MQATHSGRLERYLGTEKCEELSALMKGWYGPPIALHGVPGAVYMTGDGDFIGECRAGWEMSLLDHAVDLQHRVKRALRVASARDRARLNAGFTSLSDLISEATTGGKKQDISFQKVGSVGVTGVTNTLFFSGNQPAAGTAAGAAPAGRVPTSATGGALPFTNPIGGDTTHIVSSFTMASAAGMSLLLYDRIFDVDKLMNSTAAEAVTGVPTRYQNTTPGQVDSIAGNFLIIETRTALAATAHNWTPCTYLDQGNAASTLPSVTGNSAGIINRLDQPTQQWFCPLATGDTGIKALTNMQCSAAVATGAITFAIGHPIAWIVHPLANQVMVMDYINTAFNLTRVFDNACLALLEPTKSAATATTYTGQITLVSG
jgi:hypothetical protein